MANLSAPVNLPSQHRLHLWGGTLRGLGQPPPYPPPRFVPGSTQCTVTLAHPLCSLPDEIVKAPSVWQRRSPDARVMAHLGGAAEDSPRLRAFDRTCHQPPAVTRDTSYVTDYCLPVDKRWQALPHTARRVPMPEQQSAPLAWLQTRAADDHEVVRASRFGLTYDRKSLAATQLRSSGLDPPYHPSKHGVRSFIKAKNRDWLDAGGD